MKIKTLAPQPPASVHEIPLSYAPRYQIFASNHRYADYSKSGSLVNVRSYCCLSKVAKKWPSQIFREAAKSIYLVGYNGCPGRDRTYDQVINSHLLCH